MAQSTLSLLALYNYDSSVLDDLALPPELEASRETIVNNLLLESAELEILFPDPVTLKTAVKFWSRKSLPVWQELYDTTQYEYNPIWNKDGTFTETETRNLAGTSSNTETRNLAGGSQDTGTGSGTTEYDVFGYNSETAAHESKTTDSNTYSRTGSSTQTGTITDQGASSDTGTILHERTEQGNIGITSTQELIERQRAVVEFNIMDRIIKDFIGRFCLLVY